MMLKEVLYSFIKLAFIFCSGIFLHAQEKKKIDTLALQKEIQGVTITSKKKLIERKVDRLVFNVKKSIVAQGGDAMEALKATPGVRVQGEEIKLAGKSSVKVMVNNKIVQMGGDELQNYLKSIPTANIQKIEVITNPPAKYEAEGNSGLINIQLKEAKQDNWNVSLRSSYRQATYENFAHGIGISCKKNAFAVLADLNYRYGRNLYANEINYYYPAEHWNNHIFNRNHRGNLGTLLSLQYDLTGKSSIGAQFLGSFSNNSSDEYNDNYSYSYTDGVTTKYYKTDGVSKGKPKNISLNLNYNQKLDDKGKKFSVDVDYFNSLSPKDNRFTSALQDFALNFVDNEYAINNSNQDIKNYSLKTDFELPCDWASFSFGAKASTTKTDNTVDAKFYNQNNSSLLSAQNDHFQYTENTQALYFSASKSFGKKWETKIGLRGENTQTKANSLSTNQEMDKNYFKLFPTVYLSYKPHRNYTFSANFGRRIQRPSFWQMNPARWYNSPKTYVTGNPFLQPRYTDGLEFNYSYKSLLIISTFFGKTKDDITQIIRHDTTDGSQFFRHENYASSKYASGSISLNYNPFKFWEASSEVSAYYNEVNPFVDIYASKYSGWGGYTSVNNTFIFNKAKTFSSSLNFTYNYPSIGVVASSSYSSLDIGFRYLTFEKKMMIGLNFEDVFRNNYMTASINTQDILQNFTQYYDTRLIRLSLTYKFGNNKVLVKQRGVGNQEEKNRSN